MGDLYVHLCVDSWLVVLAVYKSSWEVTEPFYSHRAGNSSVCLPHTSNPQVVAMWETNCTALTLKYNNKFMKTLTVFHDGRAK